jgi:hypothetical protein
MLVVIIDIAIINTSPLEFLNNVSAVALFFPFLYSMSKSNPSNLANYKC